MVSADDERRPRGPYALGMRLLRRLRARFQRIDPLRADLLLAGAFLVESQLELVLITGDVPRAWIASLCLATMAAGLAVRRLRPLVAVILTTGAFAVLQSLGRPINDNLYSLFFVLLFVLYSAGRHMEGRQLAVAAVVAWALSIVGTAVDGYPNAVTDFTFGPVVIALGPIALGRFIRHRTQLNQRLHDKAEALRRDRADQAERAAAEERNRIAGELHDVVAHAMSAMVVQAAGARRLAQKDPERAREAFGLVETTGREALMEIRRLLGVLRRDDEEIALAPQPSLRHLATLVQRARAAGLPVELEVEGDERPLPPGVDLTAYRLVQEALTGAIEHPAAGSARVLLRYRSDGIDVEVLDDGGDGRRLAGVRERVALYGGQLHAGARRGGGHAVRARLPVGGAV